MQAAFLIAAFRFFNYINRSIRLTFLIPYNILQFINNSLSENQFIHLTSCFFIYSMLNFVIACIDINQQTMLIFRQQGA